MKIAEEYNIWEFPEVAPLKPVTYKVKTTDINFPYLVDFIFNSYGILVWDLPKGIEVIMWRYQSL